MPRHRASNALHETWRGWHGASARVCTVAPKCAGGKPLWPRYSSDTRPLSFSLKRGVSNAVFGLRRRDALGSGNQGHHDARIWLRAPYVAVLGLLDYRAADDVQS